MRAAAPLTLVALVALAAGCAARQGDGARGAPAAPPRRVRVVVVDSLLGLSPLAGAEVAIGARGGVTGADGGTLLDSVPVGVRTLVVRHGALEALGLDSLRFPVIVPPGATDHEAVVALRADKALVQARCPAPRGGDKGDRGMVIGIVRDARTDAPLAGVEVRGAWREGDSTYFGNGLQDRARVRTGPNGGYALCRVPRFTHVELAAGGHDDRVSARVRVQLGANHVAQHDLSVEPPAARPRGTAVAPRVDSVPIPPLATGPGVLAGRVITTAGVGLPGVQLRLDRPASTVVTDADGRFRVAGVPAGVRTIELRAVGFRPSRIGLNVRPGQVVERDITIDRTVAVLGTVTVTATGGAAWDSVGFEERRRKGGGYFLTREDLANVVDLSTALRLVPGIRGRSNDKSQRLIAGRGAGCFPAFVVNGTRFAAGQNIGPEALIRADDIRAMEVYTSRLSTPPEHQRFADCAVVVIWLRNPQLEREAAARRAREARAVKAAAPAP